MNKQNTFESDFVALRCPSCGAPLTYNEANGTYNCSFCGISFIMKKKGNAADSLSMARKEYEKERYDDARRYYAKALEEDPDSWEADLGVATCDMLKSKWNDYRADQFKSNIKEIRKQIDKLPESEIYEAKYTLGGMIADVALYVNNELEDPVYDGWMRNTETGRRYPEPDVSSHELMEDVKDWILEETQLMFESEPGDGPIPEDKVKLIEMLFNYVYAKDTYTIVLEGYGTHPIDDYFRNKKDMYKKMLEKRNPGYKFYQNVTLRY